MTRLFHRLPTDSELLDKAQGKLVASLVSLPLLQFAVTAPSLNAWRSLSEK